MTPPQRYAWLRGECRARRLRLTPQRDALLRVLSRVRHHPTADDLYRSVRRSMPAVSPATVYRNAQQLARAGIIAALNRAGATQYDPNPDEHHHFICDACGSITDIYLSRVSYRVDPRRSALRGTRVHGCEVQLRGRCARCRQTQ